MRIGWGASPLARRGSLPPATIFSLLNNSKVGKYRGIDFLTKKLADIPIND